MTLEEKLKQLKTIEPDPTKAAASRHFILSHIPRPAKPVFSFLHFILQNVQSAGAIALTGALLVLIFGGFSILSFNPFRLSSLDPTGLRAEAQDIDVQIQLAAVDYEQTAQVPASPSSHASKPRTAPMRSTATSTDTGNAPASTSSATSSPEVNIDQALDALTN